MQEAARARAANASTGTEGAEANTPISQEDDHNAVLEVPSDSLPGNEGGEVRVLIVQLHLNKHEQTMDPFVFHFNHDLKGWAGIMMMALMHPRLGTICPELIV